MRTGAGILRDRVTIYRPSRVSNGKGGQVDAVTVVAADIACRIETKRGGEEVQARRLSGVTPVEVTMRHDPALALSTADYLTDAAGVTYAIRWVGSIDEGRKRWTLISAETGKAVTR